MARHILGKSQKQNHEPAFVTQRQYTGGFSQGQAELEGSFPEWICEHIKLNLSCSLEGQEHSAVQEGMDRWVHGI